MNPSCTQCDGPTVAAPVAHMTNASMDSNPNPVKWFRCPKCGTHVSEGGAEVTGQRATAK